MAYDEVLAERIRTALHDRDDVVEEEMFGGIKLNVAESAVTRPNESPDASAHAPARRAPEVAIERRGMMGLG